MSVTYLYQQNTDRTKLPQFLPNWKIDALIDQYPVLLNTEKKDVGSIYRK